MTHVWVDASAGVAGDMLLGALLDAGADLTVVQQAVDAVVPASVRIEVRTVTRAGMRATKAEVRAIVDEPPHRHWSDIAQMVAAAGLADQVRDRVQRVFAALAEAEGHAHGIPPAEVHFHEVGALDSIADVVGVCAALSDLGVETLSAGEAALGSGRIEVAHGSMAVPGPAVTELSRGWRVSSGGDGELTTPTGMALLTALGERCEDLPPMTVERRGVGAGTRDVAGRPNVTRVLVGELSAGHAASTPGSRAVVLEANVDDLDPRLWPDVLTGLIAGGADDAWLVPIQMKKGRPAHTLAVLCDEPGAARLRQLMVGLTSTIGVRQTTVEKHALPRMWVDVEVDHLTAPVKLSHEGGRVVRATPEFDGVARLATATGRTQQEALAAVTAAASAQGLVPGAAVADLVGKARTDGP